jgi:hypothetical protein
LPNGCEHISRDDFARDACQGNPRQNEKAVATVAASIAEFGWRQPIVVDENVIILAGHNEIYSPWVRLEAMAKAFLSARKAAGMASPTYLAGHGNMQMERG